MKTLSTEGLDAIFDIEFADGPAPAGPVAGTLCHKCKGLGNFFGYSGRVVGKCFACGGTGLSAAADGKPDGSTEINVTKIAEAFERAKKAGLKRPKVTFKAIQFSRALPQPPRPTACRSAGAPAAAANSLTPIAFQKASGRFVQRTTASDAIRGHCLDIVLAMPSLPEN